jgi:hypothetical protein
MLNNIDKIDWQQLTHAYGSAEDVPQHLHALLSPDKEKRDEAFGFFWGSVIHQGTVYEVTAHVVPFLLELLQTPDAELRRALLPLLAEYAQGSSYHDAHADLAREAGIEEVDTPEWQAVVAKELSDVDAAHAAVVAGLPVYEDLLRNAPEVGVRAAATLPLATCQERINTALPLLMERLRTDAEPIVQASCLLALERLALSPEHQKAVLGLANELSAEQDTTQLVRIVAALVVARRQEQQVPTPLFAYLLETLDNSAAVAGDYAKLPWNERDNSLDVAISYALTRLGGPYATNLLPHLIRRIPQGDDWDTSSQATSMVFAVVSLCDFEAKNGYVSIPEPKIPLTLSELTPLQHETLLSLCDVFDTWTMIDGNLLMYFHNYGLPDPREMRHYLETGEVIWLSQRPDGIFG